MQITTRNFEGNVSEAMQELVESKLGKLNVNDDLKLVVEKKKDGVFKTTLSFTDKLNRFYVFKVKNATFETCLDELKEVAKRAVRKYKEKKYSRTAVKEELPAYEEVVKEKIIVAEQESQESAIDNMHELGHTFYIYRDSAGDVCVLYNRYDGSVGKIRVK